MITPPVDAAFFADARAQRVQMLIGYAAIALTVLIWASFALATRAASASALTIGDVALIRSVVPALILLPFMPARLAMVRAMPLRNAALIAIGAGAPFIYLAALGGAQTSATHVGALIAGTTPISVAVLLWLTTRERPSKGRMTGMVIIMAGAAVLVASAGGVSSESLKGILYLLGASLLWASYSMGQRGSGLDPVGCAIVMSVPSAVALAVLWALGVIPSNLSFHQGGATFEDALPFLLVQGIGAGVISSMTYAVAISRLGVSTAATIGALAPAIAAVIAVPVLGERLSIGVASAVLIICAGVILSNRMKR
ncbi:DMT family transporter [Albirhodobacter sp. R86504]|uniref:DMT family transporter n=1 Tax=Albirhodobacter sp. R86504 TaxID=3093848 RepID=UPI00366C3B3B